MQNQKLVDQVEGADAPLLTQKFAKHFGSGASVTGPIAPAASRITSNASASTSASTSGISGKAGQQEDLQDRLQKLVHSAPVLLFMKGSPAAPRCGFSSKVVQALQTANIDFQHFDILSDEAVRQGLKVQFTDRLLPPVLSSQLADQPHLTVAHIRSAPSLYCLNKMFN